MKRLQSKGSLVKSIGKYYAKRHTYRYQIQSCRRKKTVPPYICRMFFRQIQTIGCKYLFYKNSNPLQDDIQKIKQQSLAGWYSKNKTAIPACMYLSIN